MAYNFAKRLKVLKGKLPGNLTTQEHWTKSPEPIYSQPTITF
ncbi:hypothetical protein MIDIC_330017 [Alphaproteobacteria bacterium]